MRLRLRWLSRLATERRWRCLDGSANGCENGDQAPQGRHRPFRALPADLPEGVVMLVPVLRGRAAVTLGHNTSLLGLDGLVTARVAPAAWGTLPVPRIGTWPR